MWLPLNIHFTKGLKPEKSLCRQPVPPDAAPGCVAGNRQRVGTEEWNAIGIIETLSVAAGIEAADRAAKNRSCESNRNPARHWLMAANHMLN